MVTIVPTHSSHSSPLLWSRNERAWNRVNHELAPGSKPNNMAAVMEVNVSPLNWRFDQYHEFLRGKAALDLEQNILFFLGKRFPTSTWTGKRAGAGFDNTRVHELHKWPFHGDLWLWLELKKDAWWTLWYFKMRWVVLKAFLVTATITDLRSFVIQVMRWAKWEITRPRRSDISIAWELCSTEPHMLSIFRSVSRWTIKFNGVQSLPKDYSLKLRILFTHRKYSSRWTLLELRVFLLACRGYSGVNHRTKTKTWNFSSKSWFIVLVVVSFLCSLPNVIFRCSS